jgi:hypothetical protein
VGARVCVGLVAAAAVAAGCGQAAAPRPARASAKTRVYHVSVTLRGVAGPSGAGRSTEWLDPAGRRYRVIDVQAPDPAHHQPAATTLDVGGPGVDETTTSFGHGGAGTLGGAQTMLAYGAAGMGPGAGDDAMAALRAYLGYHVRTAPRFTVEHRGGRVELVIAYPGFSTTALKRLGAPPSALKQLRAMAHAHTVVTILGSTTQRDAQRRGIFAIDPGKADEIERSLRPGVAPPAPRPAYWVGPVWRGVRATHATTVTATHGGAAGDDSYDVAYGPVGRAGDGPLDIGTQAMPGGAAIPLRLRSLNPFGARGHSIRLADGTRATFLYGHMPASVTKPLGGAGSPAGGIPPGGIPPFILVITRHATIDISPGGALGRPAALVLAESLRPV